MENQVESTINVNGSKYCVSCVRDGRMVLVGAYVIQRAFGSFIVGREATSLVFLRVRYLNPNKSRH